MKIVDITGCYSGMSIYDATGRLGQQQQQE